MLSAIQHLQHPLVLHQGSCCQCTMLLGAMLPGAMLPGAMLPGAMLPGAMLPGALLPGFADGGPQSVVHKNCTMLGVVCPSCCRSLLTCYPFEQYRI